jgi:hypothetical protein
MRAKLVTHDLLPCRRYRSAEERPDGGLHSEWDRGIGAIAKILGYMSPSLIVLFVSNREVELVAEESHPVC